MAEDEKEFDEIMDSLKDTMEHRFFREVRSYTIKKSLERMYNKEIIKKFYISELIPDGSGDFIIRFEKRYPTLTEEQYQEEYFPKPEKQEE